jgi:hypothetical protein
MILTLILISFLCLLVAGAIVGYQVFSLRAQKLSVVSTVSIRAVVENKVDSMAFYIVMLLREILHHIHIYFLVVGQKLALIIKYISHRLERKFGGMINTVKGKQELSRQGDASYFLKEIKEHQEMVKAQNNF